MRHNDPYHSGDTVADHLRPRPPEVIAAEAEYQRWNALVRAGDVEGVLALHRAELAQFRASNKET